MEFLQQTISLLSEPPANVVYHLVMLFALQVVFATSLAHWRRYPEDSLAQRLTWAAAAIFIGRLFLLIVGLLNSDDPQQLAVILPPLEQAINTMTVAVLIWSLVPLHQNSSRLADIALVIIIALCGVLYLFFAQEWQNQINDGVTYYNSTLQSTVWTMFQIFVLVVGLAYLLIASERQDPLPTIITVVLLVTTALHLFNRNEFIPSDTNIPYMIRLGYLIAFPLWAVFAYQKNLTPLLAAQSAYKSSVNRFGNALSNAAQIIATRQLQRRIVKSIEMASDLLEAEFVGIGLTNNQNPFQLTFLSNLNDENTSQGKSWTINLNQITTFNLALTQGNTTELLSEGIGARQFYNFYKAAGMEPKGPIIIQSLNANGQTLGLLIAAAHAEEKSWPEDKRNLLPGLASYQAQAILNCQVTETPVAAPQIPDARETSATVPSAILIDQVHLHSLQAENKNLRAALDKAKLETKQAVAKALAAQKQARYLAAALRAAQQSTTDLHSNMEPINVDTVVTTPKTHSSPAKEAQES